MRFCLLALFPMAAALCAGPAYEVETDIEYAAPGGEVLKLDAHVPAGEGPFPAVILVHGGGWVTGSKTANFVRPLFAVLDQTEMAWFTIDYRLAPKHPYPAARTDVEAAVEFVKQNARRFRVDPNRIALMGESAGGHLVNLVGTRNDAGVAAVVCFYGPIDMEVFAEKFAGKPATAGMKTFFLIDEYDERATAILHEASPRTYLNGKTPPFLVIHGTEDAAVPYAQALLHVKLFRERGIPVELITVEGGVHGVINWEKDRRFWTYKQPMVDWLRKTLGAK
ncbi:MAG: alpha/beta hydrolase [Bryobacteraceae bacterium]